MDINKVGNRGTLFTFYDLGIPTNVYVIRGNESVYIVDTYLGPDSMKKILEYINDFNTDLPIVVINTHSHWDHVWGNCLFNSNKIFGSDLCKRYIIDEGEKELQTYGKYTQGDVTLVYPNNLVYLMTEFSNDHVLVYYSPGHTDDSITVVDLEDKVLYAGDNLERPIPYFSFKDLKRYKQTLEEYASKDINYVIGGHTGIEDKSLITHNLNYINRVLLDENIEIESKEFLSVHQSNMEFLNN